MSRCMSIECLYSDKKTVDLRQFIYISYDIPSFTLTHYSNFGRPVFSGQLIICSPYGFWAQRPLSEFITPHSTLRDLPIDVT